MARPIRMTQLDFWEEADPAGLPGLSKSRFLAAFQCPKRVWLETHRPDLATPPDPARRAGFAAGTEIGEIARRRYPGGVLVAEGPFDHDRAVRRTRDLLRDPSVPAIYEGAFRFGGVRVRADVLVRAGADTFDLVEVKGSTRTRELHLADVGIQAWVIEESGVPLNRIGVLRLNPGYTYTGGEHDLERLLEYDDQTEAVRERREADLELLEKTREVLLREEMPSVGTGPHCRTPWPCPFLEWCSRDEPEYPLRELTRIDPPLFETLRERGIRDIREIPEDFPGLSALQRRAREAVVTGQRYVDGDVRRSLAELRKPVGFLDFETFAPALPVFAGTRPFQTIPFQWSLHVEEIDGSLRHREYLHEGSDDPRAAFLESLLEATGDVGSILVYSGFEAQVLRDLVEVFPGRVEAIASLTRRLFDLLPVVRNHVYDPEFRGSYSIKRVLPALVPELGYGGLEITDGAGASVAYAEARRPGTDPARVARLRRGLRRYCRRDTEAMVALYRALRVPLSSRPTVR